MNPFSPDLLSGQVWLITGGGTGIGRATADLAAALGASVAISSRHEAKLEPAARALRERGASCLYRSCDIREPDQISALVDEVLGELGRIDVLVNNAGGQFPTPARTLTPKGFETVIRNNLSGTFFITREIADRVMIPARSGAIVNVIANIYRGFPGMSHTGAARAGVDNLTKSLAVEWACHGLRINAVAPGVIASSGMDRYPPELVATARRAIPFKRLGTVEETAAPIVFLGSPAASYITGATLYVDGGQALWGDIWPIPDPEE